MPKRVITTTTLVLLLFWGSSGCFEEAVGVVGWDYDCMGRVTSTGFTKPELHQVDLLFVIDNSASMAWEQRKLIEQFPVLMRELRGIGYRMPDMHIGVTSVNLGIGPHSYAGCEELGGDGGAIFQGCTDFCPSCNGVLNGSYIVDVQPSGCVVVRGEDARICESHDCTDVAPQL